jgi:hypothetical protein
LTILVKKELKKLTSQPLLQQEKPVINIYLTILVEKDTQRLTSQPLLQQKKPIINIIFDHFG